MDATVTFKDGSVHTYQGVPDGTAPEAVEAQAMKDFSKPVASLSGAAAAAEPVKPGLMQRVKNAVIAPVSERDASLGDAVKGGILEMPQAIGHEFMDNARALGHHINPQTPQDVIDAAPVGLIPKPLLDLGGMAMAPITGALKSVVGRPVEQQTGIRRDITGDVLSAAVPLGGEANLANDAAKVERATAALKPMAAEAHAAGFVLPPKMMSDKPGIVANTLAGWSGKVKTAQAASAKNQDVTNGLAAKALGLPEDASLTPATFKTIRADAGKAYQAIPEALPQVTADDEYLNTVTNLNRPGSEAAQRIFPNTTKNQGIIDLQDELGSVKTYPTAAGLELVKELRTQAASNLKAYSDPSKLALGTAQKKAANAVDDLIERNVAQSGNTDLVQAYKDARVKIAKSYDVEAATNPATWDVDAQKIAKLSKSGQMTDELSTIAKVAQAFPKAMQSAAKFGDEEPLSVLDVGTAVVGAAHGKPSVVGAVFGRPLARKAVLSKPVQNALAADRGAAGIPLNALRRAPAINAFHALAQEPQQ